jgi:hypothetical protein
MVVQQPKVSAVIVSNAANGGGAEKSMAALHRSFFDSNIHSSLVTLNTSADTEAIPNSFALDRKWNSGLRKTLQNFIEFNRLIKKLNPQVLILNCELPELYGALLKFNGIIICVEHSTKPWKGRKALGVAVRLALAIRRVKWVSVVKNQKRVWCGFGTASYIPNPYVSVDLASRTKSDLNSITYIGGLKKDKRPEWVILAGIKTKVFINVFGNGVLKRPLEDKYQTFSNQIKFYGFQPNPWRLISSDSLVIVPSLHEGDGMVVFEAVLSNNPILLFNNNDLMRFKFDKRHYFSDFEELVTIINGNKMSNFQDLRVSKDIYKKLLKERSLNRVSDQWCNLILSFVG